MLRHPHLPNVLVAILAPIAIAVALVAGGPDALLAAPSLICLVPLLLGRYIGEEKLGGLARWVERRRRPRPQAAVAAVAVRPSKSRLPRGGRLIAACLAVRPPPAALRNTA